MNSNTPIEELTKVGKTTALRLKNLNLKTVADLIYYFPFRYEDFSKIKNIADLVPNESVTIKAKIQLIANRRSFRKKKILTEALVDDGTGSIKILWFNQPFIIKNLKVNDEIYLSGSLDESATQMVSPDYEKIYQSNLNSPVHTGRIVPIYHLTQGITQKQIRFLLNQCQPVMQSVQDYLPEEIIQKYSFISLNEALVNIHFPQNFEMARKARQRLEFDELFLIQLYIQKLKKQIKSNKAIEIKFLEKQTKDFVDSLPFKLTNAQKKSSWSILQDMTKGKPMNRLLEGDVGSGKTVVISLGILNAILNGYRCVVMAPTEILASQHYQTFLKLFNKYQFQIGLFTAGKKFLNEEKLSKVQMLQKMENGEVDLIFGTQALIQENVQIKDLGLVVVDEQHRFGVNQRKKLLEKNKKQDYLPHFLSMTATPIPRTLVLTLYGDLDLSIIDEMPPGREKIITRIVFEQQRIETYDFIREQIKQGRQAFVICPLIDPSDKLGVKSAVQEFEKLSKEIFPDLKISLMHGRLKSKEKEQVMQDFADKKSDILVSTSVIEVGIDVPNSTIMMIEGADRFGLAQLHQFRGRVGRGQYQSYCFLFSESNSLLTKKRLKYLETYDNGFALAEKDLELRGPGEVYGAKQSGLPDLKIASLTNVKLIEQTQKEAENLINNNEHLAPALEKVLDGMDVVWHFE